MPYTSAPERICCNNHPCVSCSQLPPWPRPGARTYPPFPCCVNAPHLAARAPTPPASARGLTRAPPPRPPPPPPPRPGGAPRPGNELTPGKGKGAAGSGFGKGALGTAETPTRAFGAGWAMDNGQKVIQMAADG